MRPSKRPRILVIEDEESIRVPLVDTLEDEGFEVLEAADGERGRHLALTEDPDLILLDLMLPKVDGFTILRDVRRDRGTHGHARHADPLPEGPHALRMHRLG